jgi:hypothetical protein
MTKLTARTIWFVSMAAPGLILACIEGATAGGLVKAGLFLATICVLFLLCEVDYFRHPKEK